MDNAILGGAEPTVEATPPVAVASEEPTSFNDFLDEGESEVVSSPAVPVVPEVVSPVTTPDGAVEVGAPVVPPVPVVPPSTPPVAAAQVVTPPPPAPPSIPGAVIPPVPAPAAATSATDLGQIRENLVTEIATRYAMPEAVKDEFMMNPDKVLPTFAARLFVDIYDAVINTVMAQVPQVMATRESQVQVQRSVEDKFFARWPSLKEPSLQGDIASVGRAYRQQNPSATFEQTIEAVGAMVSVMKGVPLPGQTNAPAQAPPQMRPPTPAGVGASRSPAPAAVQGNIWNEFTDE